MSTFPTTYASSDTGLDYVPKGIPLNGNGTWRPQPNRHSNGSAHMSEQRTAAVNDPLSGMTPWQIYQRCIWISDEDTNAKISLLCLSRFMDKDLRAASMSYTQWARDCGFSERTAKRCAQVVANTWLRIGVGKGRYIPGKGHENRYDGVIPTRWADELRRRMRNGIEVKPDEDVAKAIEAITGVSGSHPVAETGVSEGHPEQSGVTHRHPENPISGCQAGTGVSDSPVRGVRESHVLQIPPDNKNTLSGAGAPDAGATLFPDEPPARNANWKPTKPEIERGFTEWWAHYPKKEDKGDARKAYERRVTHLDPKERATIPQLLAAVKAYPFKGDRQYIKHPATWLNKGSWMEADPSQANAPTLVAPADPDAALKHLLASPFGQRTIEREGHDKGMETLRARIAANRKGANDA